MFVLLRQLATIRRTAALDRPQHPRSLGIRHVDAGSCHGCEHELGAATNPYHDLQRHGLDIVASPRHADILLITGPITTPMTDALRTAYDAMPEPRLVAALGDCALGRNIIGAADTHNGGLQNVFPVDIRIPGCPPTPTAIAEHLLAALAARDEPVRDIAAGADSHQSPMAEPERPTHTA